MNCKSCHFSIMDVIDPDYGIEVMLFCSFHDCLPEDVPEECNIEEILYARDNALIDAMYDDDLNEPPINELNEMLTEDEIPF